VEAAGDLVRRGRAGFVNLYFVAITWLPWWAPEFIRKYIKLPTVVARAVASQLKNSTFEPALVSSGGTVYFDSGAFHDLCFKQTEIFGGSS
jgi:hypothetical protein